MLIKTLYVRFYKSFNYDYLRKSDPDAAPHPWDLLGQGGLFYPFVRIPLERDITTVVGANESGKSQLLTAIKCLLTGAGIERRDFCRYSAFFAVDKEMAVPEFGAEYTGLTETDANTIRTHLSLDAGVEVNSFWFFRFNKRNVVYARNADGTWVSKPATAKALEKVSFPTHFEIDAQIPLPDSVPIDYLVSSKGAKKARPRQKVLDWLETLLSNPQCSRRPTR